MRPQPYDNEDELDWKGTLLDRGGNTRRRPQSSYAHEPKSRLFIIGIVIGVAAILITLWVMMSGGGAGGDMPVIKADTTPYKSKPDQPGGANIPFQDKLVFNRLDPNGQPVQAEKLLPGAEEPAADKPAVAAVTAPTPPLPPAVVTAPPPAAQAPINIPAAEPVPQAAPVAAPAAVPTPTPAQGAAATVTEQPAPVSAPKAAEKPKAAPVAAAPVQSSAQTPAGQVRVQLASIPNQQNAQKALADFKSKYSGALGSAGLSIVKADLGAKGTYYRIQSGPVDRARADSICSSIKAQGGACITAK